MSWRQQLWWWLNETKWLMRKDEKQMDENQVKPFLLLLCWPVSIQTAEIVPNIPEIHPCWFPSPTEMRSCFREKKCSWVRMEDRLEIRQQTWLKCQRAKLWCKKTHLHLDQTTQVFSKMPIFDLFEMACDTWKGSLFKPGNNQNRASVWAARRVSFWRRLGGYVLNHLHLFEDWTKTAEWSSVKLVEGWAFWNLKI